MKRTLIVLACLSIFAGALFAQTKKTDSEWSAPRAVREIDDDEFEAELSKLMHNFEVKEIVREDGESDILQHLEWYLEGKRFDGITEGTLENYERAVTKFAEAYP